jgi:phosphoribosyl 1,2-cyclic phosphate phosphodiesterase
VVRALRLTFLGTGSAWPIPRIGCDCPQCASGDPRDVRSRSAAVIEAAEGGSAVLVDAGPDIYRQLCALGKERVSAIEALVLTHVHPDHYLGLVDLAAALPRQKRPVPLYHLEDNRRALEGAFRYLFRKEFQLRQVAFGTAFEVAGLTFTPIDAEHFHEFSTAGLLVAGAGTRALYAPDFRRTKQDLAGLDLIAIDGSSVEKDLHGHQSIRSGLELARTAGARRTLFTHIGHVRVPHRDLETLVTRDGGPVFGIAHDGLAVTI